MTHGRERTRAGADLPFIFYKIRATRDKATLRSWQRRARHALELIDRLTPAERHEIACVWSREDCDRINSPAMRKLLFKANDPPQAHQTIDARTLYRAKFDADGQPIKAQAKKKPGQARLVFGEAANDPTAYKAPATLPLFG